MARKFKRRSDDDILQFISDLPGGNVPQYARLLGTTAIRINALLSKKENRRFAKKDLVLAAERGKIPDWSVTGNRGALRGSDVSAMWHGGKLPAFIKKIVDDTPQTFQDDALNFLRLTLEHTSQHASFEQVTTQNMSQIQHMSQDLVNFQAQLTYAEEAIKRGSALFSRMGIDLPALPDAGKDVTRDGVTNETDEAIAA